MLEISCAPTFLIERKYILHTILKEILGLQYTISFKDTRHWTIQGPGREKLILPDILFYKEEKDWLTYSSLPKQPLSVLNTSETSINCVLVDFKIPIIYGEETGMEESYTFIHNDSEINIPIDIFGSSFFMLTRYEELVKTDRDELDRFPAEASLAFQDGFLERPIVNEYIEILWWALKRISPNLKRRERQFKIIPTHDVDFPYRFRLNPYSSILRTVTGDLLKRKDILLAKQNIELWFHVLLGNKNDPFDTFDWIMNISENAGLRSAFYFMGGGETKYDASYPLEHPLLKKILNKIAARGHEIGFHASFATYNNGSIWKKEFIKLRNLLMDTIVLGGRQHYLRFQVPTTWKYYVENNLEYDSSLSYAERPGFRCGICYEYPVFDLINKKTLCLKERPLILMEGSILDKKYMNLVISQETYDYINLFKERTKLFKGNFIILWHNNCLANELQRDLYKNVIG
jgi:hypothetical protein